MESTRNAAAKLHWSTRRRSGRLRRSSLTSIVSGPRASAHQPSSFRASRVLASPPPLRSALDHAGGHDADDSVEQALHQQLPPGTAHPVSLYHGVQSEETHAVQPGHGKKHDAARDDAADDELRR